MAYYKVHISLEEDEWLYISDNEIVEVVIEERYADLRKRGATIEVKKDVPCMKSKCCHAPVKMDRDINDPSWATCVACNQPTETYQES